MAESRCHVLRSSFAMGYCYWFGCDDYCGGAVVIGFKSEVRNKVIGFGSHIQITNLDAVSSYETHPIVVGDSMMTALADYPEISHVQRFSTKTGYD